MTEITGKWLITSVTISKIRCCPMVRKLCKDTGFTLKEVYELFPSGPAKEPAKLPVCQSRPVACRT